MSGTDALMGLPESWETWGLLLAGRRAPIVEDEPQCGRYLVQHVKGGPLIPLAIDEIDGEIRGQTPFTDSADLERYWPSAAKRAVSVEEFTAHWDRAGSNQPSEDDLFERTRRAMELADAADEADLAVCIHELKSEADAHDSAMKSALEPLEAQCAEVRARFEPAIDEAKALRTKALAKVRDYLIEHPEKPGIKGRIGNKISLRSTAKPYVSDIEVFLDWALSDEKASQALRTLVAANFKKITTDSDAPGLWVKEEVRAQ